MRRRQLLARTELRRVLNTPQPTDEAAAKSERDAPPPVVKRRPGRPRKAEVMK